MTEIEYLYENLSASEIVAFAEYAEARREANGYVDADADLVESVMACPACGERRGDALLIRADDERIECATCGQRYTLSDAKPHLCHCGAPLDDAACECGNCDAEWNEYLSEAAEVRGNLEG